MDLENIKSHLRTIIDLEDKRIIANSLLDQLENEKEMWYREAEFKAIKKTPDINLSKMFNIGKDTLKKAVLGSFVAIIVFSVLNVGGLFFMLNVTLLILISIFVAPIAYPIYLKKKEKEDIESDYYRQLEHESNVKRKCENALSVIEINNNNLINAKNHLNIELRSTYNKGIIYRKYQSLEACVEILDYLESGRCYELEGADGAYNKYDTEYFRSVSIRELKAINSSIDSILTNQYRLEGAFMSMAQSINEMKSEISSICEMTYVTQERLHDIANNTKIAAWSSAVVALQVPEFEFDAKDQMKKIE